METFEQYIDQTIGNLVNIAVEEPQQIRVLMQQTGLGYDEIVGMIRRHLDDMRSDPSWVTNYDSMLSMVTFFTYTGMHESAERAFDYFGDTVIYVLMHKLEQSINGTY